MIKNSNYKEYNKQDGYIALMVTIIISMVLLVMVAQEGFMGWHVRFNVLNTEIKEQANALADGCIDQALTSLIIDPTDPLTSALAPNGYCHTIIDRSKPNSVTINTQAVVGHTYTNEGMAFKINSINMSSVFSSRKHFTIPPNMKIDPDLDGNQGSWWETATGAAQ
ncbi:MAG: hypothetical protein WCK91_02070 [bacterium]